MFVLHIFKYFIFSGGNVLFLNVKGKDNWRWYW